MREFPVQNSLLRDIDIEDCIGSDGGSENGDNDFDDNFISINIFIYKIYIRYMRNSAIMKTIQLDGMAPRFENGK